MTISDIRTQLNSVLDTMAISYGEDNELDQTELTDTTDTLAGTLDTVNPNGPCYPPTPR